MPESDSRDTRPDPLIDEVRRIRKAISDQFDNDVDRLCDDLRRREQEYAGRLVPSPAGAERDQASPARQ